ncbi:MAG TPA: HAMP domain-containing sensor histidine kinase [Lacunisphaera sp.]|nr:HAMP domain-containing sensor histidine kinase [Lacunisphaera sp.]
MIARPQSADAGFGRFRTKLLVAMMLVVTAATALALFFAQRKVAANAARDLDREFQAGLATFHSVQEVRHAALAERCRALSRRSRIHAALEDNALDLLYPSARDELVDVMDGEQPDSWEPFAHAFHAHFYRFLDAHGAVLTPPPGSHVGPLQPEEEARLALPRVPDRPQTGYLRRHAGQPDEFIDEIIAMPIFSTESGAPVAALVLGFKPAALPPNTAAPGMLSGIWTQGQLFLPTLAPAERTPLAARLAAVIRTEGSAPSSLPVTVGGMPGLLFFKQLNPESLLAPAYEVCIYPLTESLSRQRRLLWQFAGAGGLLLLGSFFASQILSRRLSVPVEQLAVDSAENRVQRRRAEAELELTHEELQRSVRFSADASHQLKTPVTVLRAGLEELLAGEKLGGEVREEVSALVHQTFRLTSVIEDLLLLSRMDAGRLQLQLAPLDLVHVVASWLDDLGALPDAHDVAIETEMPAELFIAGEKRYTSLIVQNLLENARKYNRTGGRIRVRLAADEAWAVLNIGNTGATIPPAAREHIFQRFHRGAMGENVPGHGLGLNLARELARLHRGDLRLARSEADWTEFEVRFRVAAPAPPPLP